MVLRSMVRQDLLSGVLQGLELLPVMLPLCLVMAVKALVLSIRIPLLLMAGVLNRCQLPRVLHTDIHFAVILSEDRWEEKIVIVLNMILGGLMF